MPLPPSPKRAKTGPSPSPLRISVVPSTPSQPTSQASPRRASTAPVNSRLHSQDDSVENLTNATTDGQLCDELSAPHDIDPPRQRPKSIFARLLRNPTNDQTAENVLDSERSDLKDEHGKPGSPNTASGSTATKRRSMASTAKWDKRASRKAPPPPNRLFEEEVAEDPLNRQSARNLGGHMIDETDEVEWDKVQVLPQVFLIPPDEEETAPITLYPPPPPPLTSRPPPTHFSQSDSRPTSLFSLSSEAETKNTWGGMAASFGKPPPVFKRQRNGAFAPRGVVMPKKKAEVVRDRERRMSMYTQDEMDWSCYIESSNGGVIMSPPRRASSPPPRISTPPIGWGSMPPIRTPIEHIRERSSSVPLPPPSGAFETQRPPRIMITSDSNNSLLTEDSHCQSETTITEEPEALLHEPKQSLELDNAEFVQDENYAESPISFTPPQLPEPLPSLADDSSPSPPTDRDLESPANLNGVREATQDRFLPGAAEDSANLTHTHLMRTTADSPLTSETSSSPVVPVIPNSDVEAGGSTLGSLSRSTKSRNRRSMSLTAILAPKFNSDAPPLPPLPVDSNRPIVRKQKSLKKFFFSTGDLAKEERGTELPKPLQGKSKVKDRDIKPNKEKKLITGSGSPSTTVFPSDKKEKSRSGFGMLSRPKSKPSLRIDINATKADTSRSPASAPITPTPLTASSTSSGAVESYPETPSSQASRTKSNAAKAKPTPAPEPVTNGTRGLSKRFSLSNMSGAFRRSKKDSNGLGGSSTANIPKVPLLPDAYKKDREETSEPRRSQSSRHQERQVKESAVPLSPRSPKIIPLPLVESPQTTDRPLLSPETSPRRSTSLEQQPHSARSNAFNLSAPGTPTSMHETTSLISDTSSTFELENELNHAQLMQISPRTRRNPAESLQDILGVGPLARTGTIVELEPTLSRRSVEAIVLGPLLIPGSLGMDSVPEEAMEILENRRSYTPERSPLVLGLDFGGDHHAMRADRSDSESSLESLSGSSSTCDPSEHPPPVTPSSPSTSALLSHSLPPPLPVPEREMELPALPSDCVMVERPLASQLDEHIGGSSTAQPVIVRSRKSPEGGLFRFFTGTSPKTIVSKLPTEEHVQEHGMIDNMDHPIQVASGTVPPQAYSSLNQAVQLKSLHFDGLGLELDFDGYGFIPPVPVIRTAQANGLGLVDAVEIEEMA